MVRARIFEQGGHLPLIPAKCTALAAACVAAAGPVLPAAKMRRGNVALRDLSLFYDCFGSVASHPNIRDARGMSAMPPIATESVRRNEASRCANRNQMHRSKKNLYSITS